MPRKQVEVLECDRCGAGGGVFTVNYPDGTMEFVLCDKHSGVITKLKDLSYGTWKPLRRRKTFKKVEA